MTRNTPTLAHTKTNINTASRCSQSSIPVHRFPSSGDSRSSAVTEPAVSEADSFAPSELGGKGVLGFEVTRRSVSAPAERNLRRRLPMSNENPLQHFTTSGSLRRRRSEEHTSELQSRFDLVCRLLLEKKKNKKKQTKRQK